MAEFIPYLTLALSAAAAAFTLLLLLGVGRRPPLQTEREDTSKVSDTVRTEADRVRQDAADQSRSVRQSLDEAVKRFQDSMLGRLDAGIENVRQPIVGIGQKLDSDIAKMGEDASANRDALRNAIEAKLDSYGDRQANTARDLKTELTDSFGRTTEALSGTLKLLGAQQQDRLDKVAVELKGMADLQNTAQEALRTAVENRLDALRLENATKLDEMRQTVDEKLQTALEKRLGESFRTVSEQLERVHSGLGEMQNLATGVGDLKRILSNVKVRGTMAEGQLADLLAHYLAPDQFIKNAQIKEHSAERVDFAVRFATQGVDSPLLLPIDSKFPTEDHDRLLAAAERADTEGVEQAGDALEKSIKVFAKSISDKYISPPVTTDFAILFVPTEGLFAELLRRPGLHAFLQRELRVTVAGPTNLASLLSAFQMGFRSQAIHERSKEVWKILGAVRTEFAEHGKVVGKLQKQLLAATNTIDGLGARTRAMNRKLRDVEALPSADAQAVLGFTNATLVAVESEEEDGDETLT